jgi:hypothetical protein
MADFLEARGEWHDTRMSISGNVPARSEGIVGLT